MKNTKTHMHLKKKVLLLVCALILIAVIVALINFYPILSMSPVGTGTISDTEITSVKNGMNSVFLIESNDGYIMFDAGSNQKALAKELVKAGVSASDVKHIILTHTDYDHVDSLPLFENATIYLNEDEVQMINGETERSSGKYSSLPDGIAHEDLILLKNGTVMTIGDRDIRCVGAPGHTPGSMAFILDSRYIFTGDALKINDNNISVHPFTMDEDTANGTIKMLYEFIKETELTLTAHYGVSYSDNLTIK